MKIHLGQLLLVLSALLTTSLQAAELRISGASTIFPVLQQLADQYEQRSGHSLVLSAGGSSRGIKDVRAGHSQIGMVSRALREDESADLLYTTIGLDTLAFIVNENNPLTDISQAELIALYTDRADWQQLTPGYDWPVRLVSKEVGRSTLDLFEGYTGLSSPDRQNASPPLISHRASIIGANLESLTLVAGQHGGVGYVSLGTAQSAIKAGLPARILTLNGIRPGRESISSGRYPIRRELNLVYRERSEPVEALLQLLASAAGQQVIENSGFIATGEP